MDKMVKMSVAQISQGLQNKDFSSKEITQAYLDKISQNDETIGAYLTVTADLALQQAEVIDQKRANGETLSTLAGVPAGIKDNICTKGTKTTCASKMLNNFVPPYNATVMEKLNSEEIVMLGKLNMDEFAMGSTTENSAFKVTKNPRNTAHVPGGSSGGSAAAVAADEAAFTLGSDTGGSIRQPASFCGVVGMKPTYGTVSRYGLVAFASSLDQIGPVTKTVEDSAIVLNAITGHDKRDATSINREYTDYTSLLNKDVKGMKIAIPKEYFAQGLSDDVRKNVMMAANAYEKMGAELVEVSLSSLEYSLPAYYVISGAEASSNLSRFDGVRYGYRAEDYSDINSLYKATRSEGFGKEVQRRIMLGSFALSAGYYDAYYKKAMQVRTLVRRDFDKVFEKCDVILSPVAPTTAYGIGEKTGNPLEMYLGDIYTVPVNIAGLPAISVPCGDDSKGLPVGMQLIGKPFDEAVLYQVANAFEKNAQEVK